MSNGHEVPAEVLRSPAEWCHIEQVEILDADGWRGSDGRDFTDAISQAEFRSRLATCTQRNLALPASEHHTPIDDWPEIEGTFDEVLERAAQARLGDGEHHTGTLNLTGEGNAPQDTLAALDGEIARTYGGIWAPDNLAEILTKHGWAKASETRQQVAEEIATGAHEVAEQYQATAVTQRDIAIESGRNTPKGQSHMRTAHAYRNKADGAWAVAHMVHVIGGAE